MNMESKRLPVGWRLDTLRNVLTSLESGSRPKGGVQNIKHGIPSISAEHIDEYGRFKFDNLRYVPIDFFEQMSRGKIQKGDILVVKDGATTGKVAFVEDDFPFHEAAINEHVFICRTDHEIIDPKFLYYWVWGNEGQKAIQLNFHGAAIGGINQKFVDSLFVPIPPLHEQKRIVSILDNKFVTVEQARSATLTQLKAVIPLLVSFQRQYFNNRKSKQWSNMCLEDICTYITDGTHHTPTYLPEGIPFLSVKDIRETGLLFNDCRFISYEEHQRLIKRCHPERGDVLYTKVGTTGIAKSIDVDREFSIFVSVALLKINSRIILPEYLEKVLNSPLGRIQAEKLTQGMANRNLVIRDIKSIRIPVPSKSNQNRIIRNLSQVNSEVERMKVDLLEQHEAIENLFLAFLRQAFNGEL